MHNNKAKRVCFISFLYKNAKNLLTNKQLCGIIMHTKSSDAKQTLLGAPIHFKNLKN